MCVVCKLEVTLFEIDPQDIYYAYKDANICESLCKFIKYCAEVYLSSTLNFSIFERLTTWDRAKFLQFSFTKQPKEKDNKITPDFLLKFFQIV